MDFPYTFETFAYRLIAQCDKQLRDYCGAQAFRTTFRLCLDAQFQTAAQVEDKFTDSQKSRFARLVKKMEKAIQGRYLLGATNSKKEPKEVTATFTCGEQITFKVFPSMFSDVGSVVRGMYHKIIKENESALIKQGCPDIDKKVRGYIKMTDDEKELFFADRNNWELIPKMMTYDKNEFSRRNSFYPNKKYYSHFPFSDESPEGLQFFISIIDLKNFFKQDAGLILTKCYGTQYYDYIVGSDELMKKFDLSGAYGYPIDRPFVERLIALKKNGARTLLLKMSRKQLHFQSDEEFHDTVRYLCEIVGCTPTEEGVFQYCLKEFCKDNPKRMDFYSGGFYGQLCETFYGCGFFRKTEKELLDWILNHTWDLSWKEDYHRTRSWLLLRHWLDGYGGHRITVDPTTNRAGLVEYLHTQGDYSEDQKKILLLYISPGSETRLKGLKGTYANILRKHASNYKIKGRSKLKKEGLASAIWKHEIYTKNGLSL